MRVMVIPASIFQPTYTMELSGDTLKAMQELVGGWVESFPNPDLQERNINILVNEEGLLKSLPINDHLIPFFLVGQAVAVGIDGDDWCSLNQDQIDFLEDWLFHV